MVTNQSRKHTIKHVPTDAPTHPRTHEHIHQAIHPPTMCYSCAPMTYSRKCVSGSYAAPQLRLVKHHGSTKKKTAKHVNHPYPRTRSHTHPPTHRSNHQPSRTIRPTHDVVHQYSSTYSSTWVGTCIVYLCFVLGLPLFYYSPPRGVNDPSPRGRLSTPPLAESGIGVNFRAGDPES